MAQPLSIAIVGAGGIGSAFAFQLARAGHRVTLVARPGSDRLGQLQRHCGVLRTTGERAETAVADTLDEQTLYDLVIVTTLAHQVGAVLPALQRSRAAGVHFMFSTFEPERLLDAMGDRATFGMPFVMAHLDEAGALALTISSSRRTLHSDERWVRLFEGAGIPSAFEAEMLLWLRCHAPVCISMESISVAGEKRGGGASWAEAMTVGRGMRAGFAVLRGLGYRIHPPAKGLIATAPTPLVAAMLWSVSRIASFRELLATGLNECRAMIDVMSAAALEAKPPLPAQAQALQAMKPAE